MIEYRTRNFSFEVWLRAFLLSHLWTEAGPSRKDQRTFFLRVYIYSDKNSFMQKFLAKVEIFHFKEAIRLFCISCTIFDSNEQKHKESNKKKFHQDKGIYDSYSKGYSLKRKCKAIHFLDMSSPVLIELRREDQVFRNIERIIY